MTVALVPLGDAEEKGWKTERWYKAGLRGRIRCAPSHDLGHVGSCVCGIWAMLESVLLDRHAIPQLLARVINLKAGDSYGH